MKRKILIIMLSAVVLLAACKGKTYKEASDSTLASNGIVEKTKLVKTADVSFKVKDVRQTGETIVTLTNQYSGIVMHHQLQSSVAQTERVHLNNDSLMLVSAFNTTADMAVKVPSEKLEDFINQVNRMGIYITASKMDIEDRTLDYLSTKLKANNRREFVDQQKTGKLIVKHAEDVLNVKDDIVDKQIANLRTDVDVRYSTVKLNFYQSDTILKEIVANDDPSSYNMPVFQRIRLAFASGWGIFMDVAVALINLWVFIVAGLAAWAGYRYYRRKTRIINHPAA